MVNNSNRIDHFASARLSLPKKTIGDCVESEGVEVAFRYKSIIAALSVSGTSILRSEHRKDYVGMSGLIDSWEITEEEKEWIKSEVDLTEVSDSVEQCELLTILRKIWKEGVLSPAHERELARLSIRKQVDSKSPLVDVERVINETHFSAWQYIEGKNRTIVADSTISGRYHIFTRTRGSGTQYTTWEQKSEDDPELSSLVEKYEEVRNLRYFNPNHAYIMEFQTADEDGQHKFLQIHRTRDCEEASFSLDDREISPDAFEATWVRGHTGPDGIIVRVNFYNFSDPQVELNALSEDDEAAVANEGATPTYEELRARERKVQIMPNNVSGNGHLKTSLMFKPEISIGTGDQVNWVEIFQAMLGKETFADALDSGEISRLPVHVISDGRRAILRVLGDILPPEAA